MFRVLLQDTNSFLLITCVEWYSDCSETITHKVAKTSTQDTTYCVNMDGISINPAVLELLKNKASVNEIMLAFQAHHKEANLDSKMPTVRNARSLATSRELPSGLQICGKRPAECIVLSGYNEG